MALLETRIGEAELLDRVEALYRAGRMFVPLPGGYQEVQVSRAALERVLQESPYLEGGSMRHCA
jgi:hypothetical protein